MRPARNGGWSGLRFLGCWQKTGRLANVIAALQDMAAGDAQRPVNGLSGDNYVVRSAAIHFFIAQQTDPAVWLKLLVISGAARRYLCRFVS